jgi:hypothetical protein
MNKIHEKYNIQKHSITFLISTQISRWFNLSRKLYKIHSEFHTKGLLKNVKTINESTIHF